MRGTMWCTYSSTRTRHGADVIVRGESVAVTATPLTLEAFLRRPEEEPALKFVNGVVTQKVLPKGKHSVLQLELAFPPERSVRAWNGPDRIDVSEVMPGFQLTVDQLFAALRLA